MSKRKKQTFSKEVVTRCVAGGGGSGGGEEEMQSNKDRKMKRGRLASPNISHDIQPYPIIMLYYQYYYKVIITYDYVIL